VGALVVQFVKSRGIAESFDRERGTESASRTTRLGRSGGEMQPIAQPNPL